MNEPIRILQVFAEMNRGGAETMIMNLYRYIDRDKIQFDFVVHTQEKCAFDDEIKQLGGRIFYVPKYIGINHFTYLKAWADFFKDNFEYRIVHGHVRSTASIYLMIAKKYKLITIAHSHSISSGTSVSAVIKNFLQYPIRHISDYFLACSESSGKWLFGNRIIAGDRFKILNNAIDVESFKFNIHTRNAIRHEFGIEDKYVVGHVGRFHPTKNHEFLIDIFKNVHDRHNNSVLLLIGEGILKESIQQKVREEGLEGCVIFAGIRSDVSDILQGMDIFLMPSLFEGLPVTLIEAQASGLICVISDTITKDVKISNLVDFVSLRKSVDKWGDIVLGYKSKNERKNMTDQVIKSGYDCKSNAKWLENFYSSLLL